MATRPSTKQALKVAATAAALGFVYLSVYLVTNQDVVETSRPKYNPPVAAEVQERSRSDANAQVTIATNTESRPAAPNGTEASSESFYPADLYLDYLDAARDGDLDAAYVLATALSECRFAPSSAEELAAFKAAPASPEIVDTVVNRFSRCQPLRDIVPNVESEYERWYATLRNGQHPLMMVKQRGTTVDEQRQLLVAAISRVYPEDFMYADVYLQAARFFSRYPEKLDHLQKEAWLLLYCESSIRCDSRKERANLRTRRYKAGEYDQIIAKENAIRDAIASRDWDALGF